MAPFGPYKAPPLHVRSSCPSLEHLELKSCDCKFPAIASRSLKNLVLKSCALKQLREITSPSLNNLFINGGYDTRAIVRDRKGDQRGGEWEPIKNLSRSKARLKIPSTRPTLES